MLCKKTRTHTSTELTHARQFSLVYTDNTPRQVRTASVPSSAKQPHTFLFLLMVMYESFPKKNRTVDAKCFCCCCCCCCYSQLKTYNCSDKHTRRQIHLECQPNIGNASLAHTQLLSFFFSSSSILFKRGEGKKGRNSPLFI